MNARRAAFPGRFRPRPRSWARGSARLRLTATFSVVLTAVGISIVATIFLVMALVPHYELASVGPGEPPDLGDADGGGADGGGADGAPPTTGRVTTVGPDTSFSAPAGDDPPVAIVADSLVTVLRLHSMVTIAGEGDLLRVLLTTSLVVFAAVLAVGVWASWILSGRLLRPVEHLATAAREAEHGRPGLFREHLADRAPGQPDDEFGRLATTFDDMLARLDRSFEAQRRFAANASHELRTPLATTQAMLDASFGTPRVDERLATRLREMNTRSIDTVEALLSLSDAHSGLGDDRERVDLVSVVDDALAASREQADELGIDVRRTSRSTTVDGDAALLGVLVGNLVRNGIVHNEPGGWLRVVVGQDDDGAPVLHVSSGGAVIDPAVAERLTEPFFRAEGRVAGSHGLGLALVQAVAEGHGAALSLEAPSTGGLTARVVFAVGHADEPGRDGSVSSRPLRDQVAPRRAGRWPGSRRSRRGSVPPDAPR